MEVRHVRWVGIKIDRYEEMLRFVGQVLGSPIAFQDATTTGFTTWEGDAIQVMGPGDPYHEFFGEHASGPVPLFEVDNVAAARRELEAAGIEIVGSLQHDARWEIHVRAPHGNLYELASRLVEYSAQSGVGARR